MSEQTTFETTVNEAPAAPGTAVATAAPAPVTDLTTPIPSSLAVAPAAELQEPLVFDRLAPERQKQVLALANQTDLSKSDTILTFGNKAQSNISTFSANALQSVRAVDLGPMGDKVTDLVVNIRGFNDMAKKKGGLFFSFKRHLAKVKAEYSSVEKVVATICKELQQHQVTLMQDVKNFDRLYALNLQYFKDLTTFIIAGEMKLKQERETTLVQLREKAQQTGLPEDAQAASDFATLCDQFEKKLYDLKLTRTVSLQMAPQIRMVQNNDVVMAQKIQSTIVNTIPLWQSQMLITLGLEHTRRAAEAEKAVTDLTNEMLISNAEQLHLGSVEVAKAAERGVIDIETLTKVNEEIIATLDEVGQIHVEGAQHRRDAEVELARLETELGQKMLEASRGTE